MHHKKIRIKLILLGHLPIGFQHRRLLAWQSGLFEILPDIEQKDITIAPEQYDLRQYDFRQEKGHGLEMRDSELRPFYPEEGEHDFVVAITNVPLELGHSARRLERGKGVITFYNVNDMLVQYNIPLENYVLRTLYNYSLMYLRCGGYLPGMNEKFHFAHNETRGCPYDLWAIKTELLASLHHPRLCKYCIVRLEKENVPAEVIRKTQREIRHIKKSLFFRMVDFIKKHPILFLLLSFLAAVLNNLVASYIYDMLHK